MSENISEMLSNIIKRIEAIENRLKCVEKRLEAIKEDSSLSPWGVYETRSPGPRVPRTLPPPRLTVPELTPTEREVLRIIEEKGEVTANQLARLLGISTSSATRYLRGLYRLGIIRRKEMKRRSGMEIIYYR